MVNIFILNWDSADAVNECLNRILLSDDSNFRVILINNFSTLPDLNEICKIYNSCRDKIEIYLIKNDSNLGYAGGNNAGLRFLTGNKFQGDILILNPDVQISWNSISEMKKALTGNIGIVSVRTLNTEGKIIFDAVKLNGFIQKNTITEKEKVVTDYAQGSCLLIKRDIIDMIGLFDERFFLYWEEVDFSIRVRKLGWELISVTTTSVIRNKNSIERQPLAFYYSARNSRLMKEKHPDLFSNWSYILYLIKIFLLTGKYIFKPKLFLSVILNYFSGIHDSLHRIYYTKSQHDGTAGMKMTGNFNEKRK